MPARTAKSKPGSIKDYLRTDIMTYTRNTKIFISIGIVLAVVSIGAYYAWTEFNRKTESTEKLEAVDSFRADSLAMKFETNDSTATLELGNKIIQVEGVAEELSQENGKVRVRLKGSDLSSVICQFESSDSATIASIKAGATLCLKGQCNAYQKVEMLPGGDLLLTRCVISKK
jgi:hypothetical protein